VAGSLIFFTGSFVSAFANSTFVLAFAFGLLQGIGIGLMVPAALTSFNHYFCRRRTFAMGVAQVIAGIGSMILPIILQKFIEEYGFRGTQAIISAISLHSLICAAALQPVEKHLKRTKQIAIFRQECESVGHGKPNIRSDYVDSERVVDGKPGTLYESSNDIKESPDLGVRNLNQMSETLGESHDTWESPNTEMRIANGKPEPLKVSHDDNQESPKSVKRVNGKPETLQESQTHEAMQGINSYAFLHRDEAVTWEMVKGVTVTGESKPSNTDVTNIHVKSQSLETANMYESASPVCESHVDNVNGSNSTANLDEVINKCSEQSKIVMLNSKGNQNVFDEDDEDDSVERHLLRDDFVKERYPSDRTSTHMGSTTTENQVSIIDLRAMSKYAVNTEAPNM
jgi:hypothetical protein